MRPYGLKPASFLILTIGNTDYLAVFCCFVTDRSDVVLLCFVVLLLTVLHLRFFFVRVSVVP